jgi:uncharacterized protein (TIGR03435 family)
MKLAAHYEPREEPSYDLVFARPDHRLGPQLTPTVCPTPGPRPAPDAKLAPPASTPSADADLLARCSRLVFGGSPLSLPRMTIGGLTGLLRQSAGRLVIDQTGLDGFFDIELTYTPPRAAGADTAANPGDAPDFFTAVQEQLGFKLVPSTTPVEVLVVDHIERPTEN